MVLPVNPTLLLIVLGAAAEIVLATSIEGLLLMLVGSFDPKVDSLGDPNNFDWFLFSAPVPHSFRSLLPYQVSHLDAPPAYGT